MSNQDIVTKEYMQNKAVFADVFNYLIYEGDAGIDPDQLQVLDTSVFSMPYGVDQKGSPVQKYRDVLMQLTVMEDEDASYMLLGVENQTHIHYAMPVRNMLYDALQYSLQVNRKKKERKKDRTNREQESADEFLSGFHKEDQLVPVITVVVYFGAKPWDGPLSIGEMTRVKKKKLEKWMADYHINLIAPFAMTEEEINKFHSSLREVMLYIKYSKDAERLNTLLQTDERMRMLDWEAANVINTVTQSGLKFDIKEGKADMCKAIEDMRRQSREEGWEKGREEGREEGWEKSRVESIRNIMETLKIDVNEAMRLLMIPEDEQAYYLQLIRK